MKRKVISMVLSTLMVCTSVVPTVMADTAVAKQPEVQTEVEAQKEEVSEERKEEISEEVKEEAVFATEAEELTEEPPVVEVEEEPAVEEKVELNEDNFHDTNLLQYLKDSKNGYSVQEGDKYYFKNDVEELKIPACVNYIKPKDTAIYDYTGLEKLTSVKKLTITTYGKNGKVYDFSEFKNLESLEINFNTGDGKKEVQLVAPEGLSKLVCTDAWNTVITSIDVSACTKLETLNCAGTDITELDVSACTALSELNVGDCEKLENLNCSNTKIASLDVSDCESLKTLDCSVNEKLVSLTLAEQKKATRPNKKDSDPYYVSNQLVTLNCSGTGITELDLGGCGKLEELDCGGTLVSKIENIEYTSSAIWGNPEKSKWNYSTTTIENLKTLDCNSTDIADLNDVLAKNPNLNYLDCSTTNISTLNVINNTALTHLDCSQTGISALDVDANTDLTHLDCSETLITELDVFENIALEYLNCSKTEIKNLEFYGKDGDEYYYQNLKEIYANECKALSKVMINDLLALEKLELFDARELAELYLKNLVSLSALDLDVKTSAGESNKVIKLQYLPSLTEDEFLTNDFFWANVVAFSGIGLEFEDFDLSAANGLWYLGCIDNSNLKSIDVAGFSELRYVEICFNDNLEEVSFDDCENLLEIFCTNNENMTSMSLKGCTVLGGLACFSNKLSGLDLSDCIGLRALYCYDNGVNLVDITACPYLMEPHELNTDYTDRDVYYYMPASVNLLREEPKVVSLIDAGFIDPTSIVEDYENHKKYEAANELDEVVEIMSRQFLTSASDKGYRLVLNKGTKVIEDKVESFVEDLYESTLDRQSDPSGLEGWTEKLKSGEETANQVAYGFFMSDEYQNQGKSTEDFVEDLYRGILGREPDEDGFKNWSEAIESGSLTKEEALAEFLNSEELFNKVSAANKEAPDDQKVLVGYFDPAKDFEMQNRVTEFVSRFYRIGLNREPEYGGLYDWTRKIIEQEITPEELARGFIFSEEFKSKINLNKDGEPVEEEEVPATLVDKFYSMFFDRGADESGKTNWLAVIGDSPLDKLEDLAQGFLGSQEFSDLCNRLLNGEA